MVRPKAGSSRGSGPESSPPPAKPTGRPSEFTQETADAICARLATGESLRQICRDEDMPSRVTVASWEMKLPAFFAACARARQLQADEYAERGLEVAADLTREPNCRKVELSALQWIAGKLRSDKYGDRTAVDVSGSLNLGAAVELVRERRIQRLGRKSE